jgi:NDP-sugar pyrophosphorylase family protein
MAGRGSRFLEKGFPLPKPLISVNGKPMIQIVIENLNLDARYIFICRKEHFEKYSLKELFNNIAKNHEVVILDEITEGAANTVLTAKKFINNDEELIIANSDQWVDWNSNHFLSFMRRKNADGGILTFIAYDKKWSFVKLNDEGLVIEVAEKKPISNIATVGIYYYKKGNYFVKAAENMIQKNIRVNNEFYIAPTYNEMISDGKKILPYSVSKMKGLGTPEDLQRFLDDKTIKM